MYPMYLQDRISLGYQVLIDTNCGVKLVLIVDSTSSILIKPIKYKRQFIKKLYFKGNRKSKKVIGVVILASIIWFSNIQPSASMGLTIPPAPVTRIQQNYKNLYVHDVHEAPRVRTRADKVIILANSRNNTYMIPLVYINGRHSYINEELLRKIRGGDLNVSITIAVIGVVICIMCSFTDVDAFSSMLNSLANWNAPQPGMGYNPAQAPSSSSTQLPAIPTEAQEFNDMSVQFNEPKPPKPNYVMTHDQALDLIYKTYPGLLEITETERISDIQAVKHLYHAKGVGVDPSNYGITQQQLMEIGDGGFVEYVRKGKQLPSIEHVQAYQQSLKNICENSLKRTDSKYYYKHGLTPATVYYDEDNRTIICFNRTSGDLITGDKQRQNSFDRFMTENTLGGLKWRIKWGN